MLKIKIAKIKIDITKRVGENIKNKKIIYFFIKKELYFSRTAKKIHLLIAFLNCSIFFFLSHNTFIITKIAKKKIDYIYYFN